MFGKYYYNVETIFKNGCTLLMCVNGLSETFDGVLSNCKNV